jgi:hypothetical protein
LVIPAYEWLHDVRGFFLRRDAYCVETFRSLPFTAAIDDEHRSRGIWRFDSNMSSFVQALWPSKKQGQCAGGAQGGSRMDWSRTFPHPIALKGGDEIATLAGALTLMRSLPLPDRYCALWRDAGELLVEAAIDTRWMPDAEAQLSQVLRVEGLL